MGSGTIHQWPAVVGDIFTGNPATEQKIRRLYVKHGHVLMQALAASASKHDARKRNCSMLENQGREPKKLWISKHFPDGPMPTVETMDSPARSCKDPNAVLQGIPMKKLTMAHLDQAGIRRLPDIEKSQTQNRPCR